jgi:nitrous oxidase accessory protein NosD
MKTNKKFHQLALSLLALVLILIVVSSAASAATLKVGPKEKYKTIQKAVNAAHTGDTIQVAYGTYKEDVKLTKRLTILGTKYPKVYGFDIYNGNAGGSQINGFSIQKYGIGASFAGSVTIRNNYFYNCGIGLSGPTVYASKVINNQITGGSILLYDVMGGPILIQGNTISKSKCALLVGDSTVLPTVTGNTFKNNQYAVYLYGYETSPGVLKSFTKNKYSGNKVNIGWGMKAPI